MKKFKFKLPTAFTILILISVIAAILTYIIPAGQYQYENGVPIAGTYQSVAANPQSLWDIFAAPIKGFGNALEVALFILVLGGFLGVVFETKAIDAVLFKIVSRLKGREKLLIPILMIFFAIGGTTYGMAEETIAFYPLIIPIVLAAGYDLVTVIMIIFLGSGVGVLGGIVDPFAAGIASGLAGISLGEGMEYRFLILIISLIFAIIFVTWYGERVRKNPEKSVIYDLKQTLESRFQVVVDQDVIFERKQKLVMIIFAMTFLIMTISVIPWQSKFGVQFFADLHQSLLGIPGFEIILGHMAPLGDWYFTEMTVLFFISAILIAVVYRFSEQKTVDLFIAGVKDLLSVALILGVARGISVLLNDGLIIGTILNCGEQVLTGINAGVFSIATYLVYIPLTFLIPSTSGLATASIPIIAPLADFAGVGREIVVMAFQAGAETMNFISPTQCVLIGALALTGVPYSRWAKAIWPFLIGVIVIVCCVLLFVTQFG